LKRLLRRVVETWIENGVVRQRVFPCGHVLDVVNLVDQRTGSPQVPKHRDCQKCRAASARRVAA
jgi:hypothetical protein